MRAILQRLETGDQGTFGRFTLGQLQLFSGELPWRNNAPNISCIPAGEYRCVMTYSAHFARNLYFVTGVFARQGVRIHPANFMGDASKGLFCQLHGCITLGEKIGWMRKQKAVFLSLSAIRRFMDEAQGAPIDLEVRDA
jgi:hypothetical protein